MGVRPVRLVADVSSEAAPAVETALRRLLGGNVTHTEDGLHVEASLVSGESVRDCNRQVLAALRRVERRTRWRAEWTADDVTVRFFDYVPKSRRPAAGAASRSAT